MPWSKLFFSARFLIIVQVFYFSVVSISSAGEFRPGDRVIYLNDSAETGATITYIYEQVIRDHIKVSITLLLDDGRKINKVPTDHIIFEEKPAGENVCNAQHHVLESLSSLSNSPVSDVVRVSFIVKGALEQFWGSTRDSWDGIDCRIPVENVAIEKPAVLVIHPDTYLLDSSNYFNYECGRQADKLNMVLKGCKEKEDNTLVHANEILRSAKSMGHEVIYVSKSKVSSGDFPVQPDRMPKEDFIPSAPLVTTDVTLLGGYFGRCHLVATREVIENHFKQNPKPLTIRYPIRGIVDSPIELEKAANHTFLFWASGWAEGLALEKVHPRSKEIEESWKNRRKAVLQTELHIHLAGQKEEIYGESPNKLHLIFSTTVEEWQKNSIEQQ